ncbi:MAG: ABC transporter permease [candidate division WOR-3 bacterium]|nr:MAG: ABC transporter permease [candidate division WOR-3 bacterium]
MFREIFLFELKYRLTRVSTYIYFIMFFAFAFFATISVGGAFRGANVVIGGAGEGKVLANAPFAVGLLISMLVYFGMLVIAAVMGNAGYRDFQRDTHSFFFSYPIRKADYFFGRFLGAFVVLVVVFLSIGIGAIVGSLMPFIMPEKFAPLRLIVYVQPYLIHVLPNLLFSGAVFFGLAILQRKRMPVFVACVAVLVGYLMSANLLMSLEAKVFASIIDPFGANTARYITEYWSVAEKNTLLMPLSGVVLWNRVLWSAIGVAMLVFAYVRFKPTFVTSERKRRSAVVDAEEHEVSTSYMTLPAATRQFSIGAGIRQLLGQTKIEFFGIVKNLYFVVIVVLGIGFIMVVGLENIGQIYGTTTYPVTYEVLEITAGTFSLFMLVIIVLFSGELVWRERDKNVAQIYDSLPVADWLSFLSKLGALVLVTALLLFVVMLCGIFMQAVLGYYNFEVGQYLKELYGLRFIELIWYCVLALFVQVLVNNKYLGHFVMVAFYILVVSAYGFGLQHSLYLFAEGPGYTYSDMNGYGHYLSSAVWIRMYWTAFSLLLAFAAHLFWVRGQEANLKSRLRYFTQRFTAGKRIVTAVSLIIFVAAGGYIYYNTNVLNTYRINKHVQHDKAEYEKLYSKYHGIAQPRITYVQTQVDIFASERRVQIAGNYLLQNRTDAPIDSVHILLQHLPTVYEISFSHSYMTALKDEKYRYYIYELEEPMMPGDTTTLTFHLEYTERGFKNNNPNVDIVYNGTFIDNQDYFPRIGYNREIELVEDHDRKQYGLEPRQRMAPVDDMQARMNNYVSYDGDWISLDAIVSTDKDQIGIAPGYLVEEWQENGRNYYHYVMDHRFINLYGFLSGRYEIRRDKWKNVNIEVYYHKGHEYNIDRFIHALKSSLDYFTEHFGPYQHRLVRVVEFPRYQEFAQSLTATIPYSEGIGFIARVEEDDVDYPFALTAHEVAHQWWAHQVVSADVQGATVMSEVLSQYSSLMVCRQEFSEKLVRKLLEHELDSYLRGRGNERLKEVPLMLVENQGYLHYRKGMVVMNALQDYIGEERLNRALAAYLKDFAYQKPPFTNSVEFLEYIRQAVPDSLQYIIKDMFETITLYENKAVEATFVPLDNKTYRVHVSINAKKLRADELGSENEIPICDYIDIGVLGEDDKELYLRKHLIDKPDMEFTFIVDEKPVKAGIDPYHKLIDRLSADNTMKVEAL